MTLRPPFYGFSFPYNRYNYHNMYKNSSPQKKVEKTIERNIDENNQCNRKEETEPYFFDLFGIHLYFDDILLICLIFFLYNEGVKDEGLFMALILLLLT